MAKRLYRVELKTVAYVIASHSLEACRLGERAVVDGVEYLNADAEEVDADHEIEPGSEHSTPYADARTDRRRLRTVAEYVAGLRQ
jgi:hypothetical protein